MRERASKPGNQAPDQGADQGGLGVAKCNLELGDDVRGGGAIRGGLAAPLALAGAAHGG